MNRSNSLHAWPGFLRHVPLSMWAALATVVCVTAALLGGAGSEAPWLYPLGSGAKLGLEGVALLWGAARPELPGQFRLALRVLGATAVTSSLLAVGASVYVARGAERMPAIYNGSWVLVSYALATLALFLIPRTAPRRGGNVTLLLDLLIASAGIGTLTFTLLRMPMNGSEPRPLTVFAVVSYSLSTIGILAGITVVVLRGRVVSSARGFWWFVAGQAIYVPIALLSQVAWTSNFVEPFLDAAYQLGAVVTAVAMVFIRTDPPQHGLVNVAALGLRDFNPVALLVPWLLGGFLLLSLRPSPGPQAMPLAVALTAVTVLLTTRLVLSHRENVRLLAEEAKQERRRQTETSSAVARLAGGIAHEFNNLMMIVINNAEFGEHSQRTSGLAGDEFTEIRRAGERAASLTRQLLQYSGLHRARKVPLDLSRVIAEMLAPQQRTARARIAAELTPGLFLDGDAEQITQLVGELLTNAGNALSTDGEIRVTLVRANLASPIETAFLSVGPGAFGHLSIADTGRGIAADVLPRIFDPFFSSQPMYSAPGLGLAAVYGIVAAHQGGIAVRSDLGRGTTVDVYFPLSATDQATVADRIDAQEPPLATARPLAAPPAR